MIFGVIFLWAFFSAFFGKPNTVPQNQPVLAASVISTAPQKQTISCPAKSRRSMARSNDPWADVIGKDCK